MPQQCRGRFRSISEQCQSGVGSFWKQFCGYIGLGAAGVADSSLAVSVVCVMEGLQNQVIDLRSRTAGVCFPTVLFSSSLSGIRRSRLRPFIAPVKHNARTKLFFRAVGIRNAKEDGIEVEKLTRISQVLSNLSGSYCLHMYEHIHVQSIIVLF